MGVLRRLPPTPGLRFLIALDIDLAKLLKCAGYG